MQFTLNLAHLTFEFLAFEKYKDQFFYILFVFVFYISIKSLERTPPGGRHNQFHLEKALGHISSGDISHFCSEFCWLGCGRLVFKSSAFPMGKYLLL